MKKSTLIIIAGIIALMVLGALLWFFFIRSSGTTGGTGTTTEQPSNGFSPFGRTPSNGGKTGTSTNNNNGNGGKTNPGATTGKIPTLRLLSNTPIGGYGASTTGSTTLVRWVDRGRGNVHEVKENKLGDVILSNTTLPRIFESVWNSGLTAFIGSAFQDGSLNFDVMYAELKSTQTPVASVATTTKGKTASTTKITTQTSATTPVTSTSNASLTPYSLKGVGLPAGLIAYAVSPKKDKLFLLLNENGRGVGYVSTFEGKSVTKIFDTPMTQLNVDWPEDNTIALTTKGTAYQSGFLYFVNAKTGVWTKVAGPLPGLSAKVSHDAKYAILSATGNNQDIVTSIFNVAKHNGTDALIRTMADKCTWGNFNKLIVYCAVPAQNVAATYPDDWYRGTVSTVDKLWQVNASTTELHMISQIVDQSDRVIDAINLGLDPKDNYLFFMNKNDLSFWSLDLVASK